MLWDCKVVEITHIEVEYLVEADTETEAKQKASIGDTIDASEGLSWCVYDREVQGVKPSDA